MRTSYKTEAVLLTATHVAQGVGDSGVESSKRGSSSSLSNSPPDRLSLYRQCDTTPHGHCQKLNKGVSLKSKSLLT